MGMTEDVQTIAHAVTMAGNVIHKVAMVVTHPVSSLQHAGLWVVMHGEIFAVVGIIGILLWLFGLQAGKRMLQWSLALFAVLAILSGAL